MTEKEIEEYQKAKSNILRGNDIESASYILEKHMDNYIINLERGVNPLRIAIKQILNYIEETKAKNILDVTREKVELKNRINKVIEYINCTEYPEDKRIGAEKEYILQLLKGVNNDN